MPTTHQATRPECPSGFRPDSRSRLADWIARVDQLLLEAAGNIVRQQASR